jgi:hypothetical protein
MILTFSTLIVKHSFNVSLLWSRVINCHLILDEIVNRLAELEDLAPKALQLHLFHVQAMLMFSTM